jgi:succinoglycan biosynthesis protein ExoO
VVIPAFNAEAFLARAVRSALDQTYPTLEVIVVDDGSSDATCQVARALETDDRRVRLIALPTNGGPAKARNVGFLAAKGDWIAVLDADDAFMPDRTKGLIAISDGAEIVAGNYLSYDAKSGKTGAPGSARSEGSQIIDLLSFADARSNHEGFALFQPMFRRSFLERHSLHYPEDIRHGEDFLLMGEALAKGAVFRISWKPEYLYTTRNSGWSRTILDYQGISADLRTFSEREDLHLSSGVRAMLLDRAARADDLHLREQIKSAFRERRFLLAFALAITHPVVWKFAFLKAKRKTATR